MYVRCVGPSIALIGSTVIVKCLYKSKLSRSFVFVVRYKAFIMSTVGVQHC